MPLFPEPGNPVRIQKILRKEKNIQILDENLKELQCGSHACSHAVRMHSNLNCSLNSRTQSVQPNPDCTAEPSPYSRTWSAQSNPVCTAEPSLYSRAQQPSGAQSVRQTQSVKRNPVCEGQPIVCSSPIQFVQSTGRHRKIPTQQPGW